MESSQGKLADSRDLDFPGAAINEESQYVNFSKSQSADEQYSDTTTLVNSQDCFDHATAPSSTPRNKWAAVHYLNESISQAFFALGIVQLLHKARDDINAFFNHVSSSSSGYFRLSHGYWDDGDYRIIKLNLSGYLYFWGGQNIDAWDDSKVATRCRHIKKLICSLGPNSKLQVEAVQIASLLLRKYPRLRRYFDLPAINHKMDKHISKNAIHPITQYYLHSAFTQACGFDKHLRKLSIALPTKKITWPRFMSIRLALLSFMAESLSQYSEDLDRNPEFQYFIQQLLYIQGTYILYDLKSNQMFSSVIFWEKYIRVLNEKPDPHRRFTAETHYRLTVCLHMCLKGTLETKMPEDWNMKEPGFIMDASQLVDELARLHFLVFLEQASLLSRLEDNGHMDFEAQVISLQARVVAVTSLSVDRVKEIWDQCSTGIAI